MYKRQTLTPAVELSYLQPPEQEMLFSVMDSDEDVYKRQALCAGERRLLVKALLSFRNKLVASGKPTEDINELLIRLLR